MKTKKRLSVVQLREDIRVQELCECVAFAIRVYPNQLIVEGTSTTTKNKWFQDALDAVMGKPKAKGEAP